ncbi:MAG: hypothetical protein JSV18_01020 [Candidatus Bathyarchaeota archaeon]|nr:MAG: hypothetical protein JSV18_01020 [Candidatus Bathyarchaeota archaeon]
MAKTELVEPVQQNLCLCLDKEESKPDSKGATITIDIPREFPRCGFKNFNVWGTKMNGLISIIVKCMRCGW